MVTNLTNSVTVVMNVTLAGYSSKSGLLELNICNCVLDLTHLKVFKINKVGNGSKIVNVVC